MYKGVFWTGKDYESDTKERKKKNVQNTYSKIVNHTIGKREAAMRPKRF